MSKGFPNQADPWTRGSKQNSTGLPQYVARYYTSSE